MQKRKTWSATLPLCKIAIAGTAACFAPFSPPRRQSTLLNSSPKSEADLPAGSMRMLELRGSPTRRSNVIVESPAPNAGVVYSPLNLKVQFHAFGGVEIDPSSVVVTYLKQPAIDITQRLMPFISANGINISQAEVPPGTHQFWVELKDKDGRVGGAEVSFLVDK